MILLEQLINKLFKKHHLNQNRHFDVWICDYADENQSIIDRDNPYKCCHYYGSDSPRDSTDIYKWLKFEVEDYEFEITGNEYWLFVKLDDLPIAKKNY